MSGGSSPPRTGLGGFSGMLSSVSRMSRAELERIGQAVLTRRATLGVASGLQRPDASPSDLTHTFPQSSDIPRQTVVPDTALPVDYEPTEAEMEEFENDDLLAEPERGRGRRS